MQRNERAPLTFLVQPPARKGIAVVDGARFEETATRNLPCYAAPFYVTPSPFSTTNTLIFCVFDRFACRLLATGNHGLQVISRLPFTYSRQERQPLGI